MTQVATSLADLDVRVLRTIEARDPDKALKDLLPHLPASERLGLVREALQGRLTRVFADGVSKGWLIRQPDGDHLMTDAGRTAEASGEYSRWFMMHPAMQLW